MLYNSDTVIYIMRYNDTGSNSSITNEIFASGKDQRQLQF